MGASVFPAVWLVVMFYSNKEEEEQDEEDEDEEDGGAGRKESGFETAHCPHSATARPLPLSGFGAVIQSPP